MASLQALVMIYEARLKNVRHRHKHFNKSVLMKMQASVNLQYLILLPPRACADASKNKYR